MAKLTAVNGQDLTISQHWGCIQTPLPATRPQGFPSILPGGSSERKGFHVVLFWLMKECSVHLNDPSHRNDEYMGMIRFCRALIGGNLDYFQLSKQCFAFLLVCCPVMTRDLVTQGWNDQKSIKYNFGCWKYVLIEKVKCRWALRENLALVWTEPTWCVYRTFVLLLSCALKGFFSLYFIMGLCSLSAPELTAL